MDDMGANPASGSEQDPVALIQGQLEREQAPTMPPQDHKPEPQADEPDDVPEVEPGPELPPDDGGDDVDDGEGDEAPEQQPEPATEKFRVKVDGKEIEVTRDELLAGYSRDADYRQKTMALSQTRQQVEAEAQRIQAERAHYAAQLEQVATVLQAALPPRPTQADYDADPIGSVQAERRWQDSMQQLQGVLAQRQQIEQQQMQQQQAMQQQTLAQARERLAELLPEWKKPEVAQREKPAVANHLRAIGYADHEISAAADPRALVMARESMLYRQLMAKQPQVQQRIAQAPRIVKPGANAAPPDRSKSIEQRIKRSGGKDIDAIAALLLT